MPKEKRKRSRIKVQNKAGRLGWTIPDSGQDEFLAEYIPGFHACQATPKPNQSVFDEFWASTHADFSAKWPVVLTADEIDKGMTVTDKWKLEHRVCSHIYVVDSQLT